MVNSRGLGQLQFDMIRAHSTFKLGYDNIIQLLANPPKNDLPNFLGYCGVWASSIVGHHDSEELIVFPFLNQKMDFSGEAEAHKVIHHFLDQLIVMIDAAKKDNSKFNPTEMGALMEKHRDSLFNHLDDEVEHISAAKLEEARIDKEEMVALTKKLDEHAVSTSDPWTVVPYMRGHTPPEFKDIWPPMPWVLRKVLIPYVFAMRYSGYWKYCPYAMS